MITVRAEGACFGRTRRSAAYHSEASDRQLRAINQSIVHGYKMHTSEPPLVTTHVGGLRTSASLARLYARRSRGEAVSIAELEAEVKAALRWVIAKQIEAGIEIGNNGEQQRDSF